MLRALALVVLASACSAGGRPVDERVADAVISSSVRQRLAAVHALDRAGLDVAVSEGLVTLTGRVPRPELSETAERLAREVDGVRDVRNLIRVHGPGE